jgi:hypothetical protein
MTQKGLKFGFWFDYDQTYTFVKIFQALSRHYPGASASGFVVNDRYFAHAVEQLPQDSALIRLYDLVAKGRVYSPSEAELEAFRWFDEGERLARVAYSDRHIQGWSHQELISLYVYLGNAFRNYIDREKPDVFIFNCVASQYAHLLYLILREKGVRVVIPIHFGIEDLYYFSDNPYFLTADIWETFDRLKRGASEPSSEELRWAKDYIARIRGGISAYSSPAASHEAEKFLLPSLRKIPNYVRYLKNYFRFYHSDPTLPGPVKRLATILKVRRNRWRLHKLFQPSSKIWKDFVLFPLHYEPEIATLVISPYDQASFIDLLARQLPISWQLVVKEHPVMVGQRNWKFFAGLQKRYRNLIFVDPSLKVVDLARDARAVVALNGTPILEALILRRPVVYTARARFAGFNLGVFTENFLNLGEAIAEAENKIPDEMDVLLMLVASHRHCYRYRFAEPLGDETILADDNIEKITRALMTHLEAKQDRAPERLRESRG